MNLSNQWLYDMPQQQSASAATPRNFMTEAKAHFNRRFANLDIRAISKPILTQEFWLELWQWSNQHCKPLSTLPDRFPENNQFALLLQGAVALTLLAILTTPEAKLQAEYATHALVPFLLLAASHTYFDSLPTIIRWPALKSNEEDSTIAIDSKSVLTAIMLFFAPTRDANPIAQPIAKLYAATNLLIKIISGYTLLEVILAQKESLVSKYLPRPAKSSSAKIISPENHIAISAHYLLSALTTFIVHQKTLQASQVLFEATPVKNSTFIIISMTSSLALPSNLSPEKLSTLNSATKRTPINLLVDFIVTYLLNTQVGPGAYLATTLLQKMPATPIIRSYSSTQLLLELSLFSQNQIAAFAALLISNQPYAAAKSHLQRINRIFPFLAISTSHSAAAATTTITGHALNKLIDWDIITAAQIQPTTSFTLKPAAATDDNDDCSQNSSQPTLSPDNNANLQEQPQPANSSTNEDHEEFVVSSNTSSRHENVLPTTKAGFDANALLSELLQANTAPKCKTN